MPADWADDWRGLWLRLGASGDPGPSGTALAARYAEPQRAYHTLQHITECLRLLDGLRHTVPHPEIVELALWFHDAIYDPRAADNEERSAALASDFIATHRLPAPLAACIRATRHHQPGDEPHTRLTVDIDLSILGQPRPRFAEYEAQIREEYAWMSAADFQSARTAILRQFLARPILYLTAACRAQFEQTARKNLAWSLARLS